MKAPTTLSNGFLVGFLDSIGDPIVRAKFAGKTIGEIAAEQPQSEFWRDILKSLDDKGIERLSCGNLLIGTRNRSPSLVSDNDLNKSATATQTGSKSVWWRRLFRQ